jgi:hypothetical protein
MNAYTDDVIRRTAAEAHADQPGGDKRLAGRYAKSRRTMARWRDKGPPEMRAAQTYLLNCPNPYRAWATLSVTRMQARLRDKPTSELIKEYHAVLAEDKAGEAEDTQHDLCRRTGWLDKSLSSERDAAVDTRKAALERIFAERRVTAEEVWG